jgi:hypothetical protein
MTGPDSADSAGSADSGPDHADAVRRLERLADRLMVVGPRLAGREGDSARTALDEIRAGLQRIADLAAEADGGPRRSVPALAPHALGDQALVLGHDLLGPPGQRSRVQLATALRAFGDVSALI